ncbi:MAG: hypothetical protein QOC92_3656 [Acidimicrobiaceae bacterium]|jgi:CRP-like cAMP-binding protein
MLRSKMSRTYIERLRVVPGLGDCNERELAEFAGLVDEVTVSEGTVLIREGEAGQGVFVIVDGWAAVSVHGEPIAAVGPGEFVGEVAMLDRGPRTATVVARTNMRLLVIGRAAFSSVARQGDVGTGIAAGLAARLRTADERLADT